MDRITTAGLRGVLQGGAALAMAAVLASCGTAGPVADTSGPVDVGEGRVMDVQCEGSGSPTVVLVSGSRNAGDVWHVLPREGATVIRPDTVEPNPNSVFDRLAATTRVCSYDRPGTARLDGSASSTTSVPQPTSALVGAEDLQAWLSAVGEPGPYVLVAHSWGGLIATTFAHEHPEDVAGLVLLDPGSRFLRDALDGSGWQAFLATTDDAVSGDAEAPDYRATLTEPERTLPGTSTRIPTVVISSDQEFDFGAGDANWPAWAVAQDRLADALGAEHVTRTDSGHLIPLARPDLVIAATEDVLEKAAGVGTPTG